MSSTVAKALSLLEHFSETEPELGLSELARRSGVDKAAVHRMMGAMAEAGLVEQRADTKLYRLGAGVLRLARVRETAFPIGSIVQPVLDGLTDKTGETSHASLVSGLSLGNIGTSESKKGTRVSLTAGEVLPFYSTASGLAVLAFGDPKLRDRILSGPLEAKTRFTLTDPNALRDKVAAVQAKGFSESDQANEEDVHGLAAPIFDRSGFACGAVSVSTPSHRMTSQMRDQFVNDVLQAGQTLTDGIGGRAPQDYTTLIRPLLG